MNVIRKDATIINTDDTFPGAFEVILSAPSKDRDGDTLLPEDWKTPLPEHITFDADHGMSVASTVGSGTPRIDELTGNLVVSGTYSSLARAQEVRTLVNEGHIRTTSVAFMSEKDGMKDGKPVVKRELLNGAFVAIPSNRDSLVLASKALDLKAGARHSNTDMTHIQAIYDHAVALGAAGPSDATGAEEDATGGKSLGVKGKYSAEQMRAMLAKGEAMKGPDGTPSYPIGDVADLLNAISAVGRGGADHDAIRAYIIRRANALGGVGKIPDNWNRDGSLKSFDDVTTKAVAGAGTLAQAVDAALDEAQNLISQVDPSTLPEPVQQALGLITAAENSVDELLDALGVTDPDESTEPTDDAPAAEKSADTEQLELKTRVIELAALAG